MFKRSKDTICPRIRQIIEVGKIRAKNCITKATLDRVCEVKEYGSGFVVDLNNRTCTCGYYRLSGIPCLHCIAVVAFPMLDLEEFVNDLYKCSRVAKAYSYGVPALVGRQGWPHATGYTVLPPPGRRLPGRPKKARRKELAELKGQQRKNGVGTQLRRTSMIMHCRSCTKPGHNARKCLNKVMQLFHLTFYPTHFITIFLTFYNCHVHRVLMRLLLPLVRMMGLMLQ
ncbi:hypothetical protein LINPERPRIM_LOCUS2897 [Linum perenne]